MAEVVLPLATFRGRKHYVVASEGFFEAGWAPWALTASDDRAALAAAITTVPANELTCVPELAAAGREAGVAETAWTPELHAVRACEALRFAFPTDYGNVAHEQSIAALIKGTEAFLPRPREVSAIAFEGQGKLGSSHMQLSGVVLAAERSLLVFRSEESCDRHLRGEPMPHLGLSFEAEPRAAFEALRPHTAIAQLPRPVWVLPSGEGRQIDDLQCHLLGALASAVGTMQDSVHRFGHAELETELGLRVIARHAVKS